MTRLLFAPWFGGVSEFDEIVDSQIRGFPFLPIWIVGIVSARPTIHVGLICVMLPLVGGLFVADAFGDLQGKLALVSYGARHLTRCCS